MKRSLSIWIKGNQEIRLTKENIDAINEKLKLIYKSAPHKFARKPRPITECERGKAMKFKTVLLYYGP